MLQVGGRGLLDTQMQVCLSNQDKNCLTKLVAESGWAFVAIGSPQQQYTRDTHMLVTSCQKGVHNCNYLDCD